ncbi:hypothetical protein TRVL_10228 [Trypanosoma vivax]|nr:hypothetical protein TRVL_10228 [Trypanosoma vivax]
MALFFRCVFLALLGAAALGDKGAGSVRTTRTDPRLGVLTRHREARKYPRIQPRPVVTSETGGESNTSLGGPAVQTTVTNGSTSLNNSTVSPQPELKKDCNCSEEKKKECESKCKNKEIKSTSKSKSELLSPPSQDSAAHPKQEVQDSEHVERQEQQVTEQGEAQQGPENGSDITEKQLPSATSPASGSGSPEPPKRKPAAEQVGGSSSENRPGAGQEHAAPQESDKQLGSTNNGAPAEGNVDKSESIGDTSEKEKAENNNEAKGGRDGQEKSIGLNEGRSGENGSAETSTSNLSGKTLTVLLLAIFARFGAL